MGSGETNEYHILTTPLFELREYRFQNGKVGCNYEERYTVKITAFGIYAFMDKREAGSHTLSWRWTYTSFREQVSL